jgi:Tol biopolymer transport system component
LIYQKSGWSHKTKNLTRLLLLILCLLLSSCRRHAPVTLDELDGDIVFVSDQPKAPPGWLYILDIENKQYSQLLGAEYSVPDPVTWSPDGRSLAFVGILAGDLDKSDPRYGREGILFLDSYGHTSVFKPCSFSPAWSPDGQYLAYHRDCDNNASLNISHIDGSQEQELATELVHRVSEKNVVQYIRISWSPDGRYITYDDTDSSGIWYIWVVDTNGGNPRKLAMGRHPTWSPLGNEIAFDRSGDIWTISISDEIEKKLIETSFFATWPAWSSDGQQLVFEGRQSAGTEIYLVSRYGSELDNLTNHPGWNRFPVWRPVPSE